MSYVRDPRYQWERKKGKLLWGLSPRMRLYQQIHAHNSDPVFDQVNFAFGDPGTETGHSLDAINTDRTVALDGLGDYQFFLRFEIEQTLNNFDQNPTVTFELQFQKDGGGYVDVTASTSNVRVVADSNITDGAATTNRISGSTNTFLAGEYDEGDGDFDAITFTTASQEHTELLSSLEIVDADMAAGAVLDFRIVEVNDVLLDAYTVANATLNWNAPAGGATPYYYNQLLGYGHGA